MTRWTVSDIPALNGRLAVVTGTGGLGFEDALALARADAQVILAGRDPLKGISAVSRILSEVPGGRIHFEQLDLASLASIADFGKRMVDQHDHVDLLVNNAGVMVPPTRKTTADGFELQFGTNYLGHFALTAHLLPLLCRAASPRVVSVSSVAAQQGAIAFDDLAAEQSYAPMPVYAQSKLANLLFALELQRRSDAAGWGIASIAAHPGISRTDLLHNGPGPDSFQGRMRSWFPFLFQPVERGALPTLYAATSPEARPGSYYGPDGLAELRGWPTTAKMPPRALDRAVAARLWDMSEAMTGVSFADPVRISHAAQPIHAAAA